MAVPARRIEFEREHPVEDRTVLEERVTHIQGDVADLKADVRRVDAKCDALGQSLAEHRLETERSFGALRAELRTEVGALRTEMKGMQAESEKAFGALRAEMKAMQAESEKAFGALRADMKEMQAESGKTLCAHGDKMKAMQVSLIRWMLGLSLALATLVVAVAQFLK